MNDKKPFTGKKILKGIWVIIVIIFASFIACLLWVLKWLVKPFYFWKKSPWILNKKRSHHGNKAENTPEL